jgi:hypothetical protein
VHPRTCNSWPCAVPDQLGRHLPSPRYATVVHRPRETETLHPDVSASSATEVTARSEGE